MSRPLLAVLLGVLLSAEAAAEGGRPRLLPLPDVRQHAVYACGAGALQAVLAYYGIDARQDTLMARLGTNAEIGTRWWEIVRVASEHGLAASPRWGLGEAELRASLDRGVPVILAIQAWAGDPPTDAAGWAERTRDGHYVVAVGHDAERFYFEDPAIFGIGWIAAAELGVRWHDYDEHGNRLERFGILVERAEGPDALPAQLVPIR
jgi:hypothetical protein